MNAIPLFESSEDEIGRIRGKAVVPCLEPTRVEFSSHTEPE